MQSRAVLSQSSYYSHDALRLHFGLGAATKADRVEVRWPSGRTQVLADVPARQVLTIREAADGNNVPTRACARSAGAGRESRSLLIRRLT